MSLPMTYPVFRRTGAVRPRCSTHLYLVYLARFRRACPGGSDNWRGYTRTLRNTFPEHLRLSVGPVPAGATTGGLHQDAAEHLPGAFTALRRACPGGSDNWRGYTRTLRNTFPEYLRLSVGPVPAGATTGGLHQDATEHFPGAFTALRRACPGGSTTLQATCVPTQSLLPPGQARRRARYLPSLGSQPVVIPPGQARRKSHGLV